VLTATSSVITKAQWKNKNHVLSEENYYKILSAIANSKNILMTKRLSHYDS